MPGIRRAETCESEMLTDIAIKSEAHWGYDSVFMDNFKLLYKVTAEFIRDNPTFVIEEDKDIIGFYGLISNDEETCLEYLYIDPQYIGKGYGKLLWNHMVDYCKGMDIRKITFVTSPQAKEFYIKMGAVQYGEVESIVMKGRRIPKLVCQLDEYTVELDAASYYIGELGEEK